jgi:DNA invertase Pin-like site-specific DNA recombinase
MMLQMRAVFAADEARKISQRTRAALAAHQGAREKPAVPRKRITGLPRAARPILLRFAREPFQHSSN